MKTRRRSAAAAFVLCLASAGAGASPASDADKARADCRMHKETAASLEHLGEDSPLRRQAARAWENACALAQALMDQRDGKPILQADSQ